METFKRRLVAKSYSQYKSIDNQDIFSSVTMLKSIWTLLAIAVAHDYEIWQIDVKTIVLNGYLEKNMKELCPTSQSYMGCDRIFIVIYLSNSCNLYLLLTK